MSGKQGEGRSPSSLALVLALLPYPAAISHPLTALIRKRTELRWGLGDWSIFSGSCRKSISACPLEGQSTAALGKWVS